MANMTIGNLAVMLSANSSQFVSGVNRAGKSTTMFAATANRNLSSVGGAMDRLGKAALRLGPLLGIGLGLGTVVSQLQRLDEVGKTASRLGLATDELSRLQFAGEQTGVAVSTMNMALQRMTRRVAEAAAGTGEAKAAIAELGLDAAALNAMGPAKAFVALSEAIKGVKNPSDRVRLAMKLFDSEGVALVNTMALGAEGLQEMAKRSDELGNTVSDKAAKSAAEFNDAVNELRRSIGGAAGELVKVLSPALKTTINFLTDGLKLIQGLNMGLVKNVVQITAMAAGFATAVAAAGKFISIGASIIQVIKNITKAAAVMQVILNPAAIVKITAGIAAAVAVGIAVEAAFEDIAESSGQAAEGIEGVGEAAESAREKTKRLTEEYAEGLGVRIMDAFAGDGSNRTPTIFQDIAQDLTEVNDAMKEMSDRAASIFKATRTPAEKMAAKLKEIKQLMSEGFLDPDTAMRAIAQLNERQQQSFMQQPVPELTTRRVSFAALGAEGAAGFKQDKVEKNTAEEVKESKKQTKALTELLRIGTNSQGAAITLVNF